jgi:putative pyruvate formate lyase activating enzyme
VVEEAFVELGATHLRVGEGVVHRQARSEEPAPTSFIDRIRKKPFPSLGIGTRSNTEWGDHGYSYWGPIGWGCRGCQNDDISQLGAGREVEPEEIAAMMLALQERGCHNINFVTPSHVVPQILAAVAIAAERGLSIPLVYNTGGYDALVSLKLIDGVVDIYMPYMKYAREALARRYSKVRSYPAINQAAVKEMHRQVGDLVCDDDGIAQRGLLVRHLVLPNGIAGTADIVRFLAQEISPDTFLNVMDQYRPCFNAFDIPALNRPVTRNEYRDAIRLADAARRR